MADPEPYESFVADTKALARSWWRRLLDRGREWLTIHLLWMALGAIGSVALAAVVLPVFAAIACGVVTVAAVVYAIWSRRLMHLERRNRRWANIGNKRIRQNELRALSAVDAATLIICGDRQVRFTGPRNPELIQAVMYLQGQTRHQAIAVAPQPARASSRMPAAPAKPDTEMIRRRLQSRQAEIEALEAEIQSLAVPDDSQLAEDATSLRQAEADLTAATAAADREARDRRRRGQKPTAPAGTEIGLQLQIGPTGVRGVKQRPAAATPEQLVQDALNRPTT